MKTWKCGWYELWRHQWCTTTKKSKYRNKIFEFIKTGKRGENGRGIERTQWPVDAVVPPTGSSSCRWSIQRKEPCTSSSICRRPYNRSTACPNGRPRSKCRWCCRSSARSEPCRCSDTSRCLQWMKRNWKRKFTFIFGNYHRDFTLRCYSEQCHKIIT